MAATSTRKSEPTPLYALVGATDLAVESVRHAFADAAHRRVDVQSQLDAFQVELGKRRTEVQKLLGEPKRLQAELEQVPAIMIGRTMEAAAKAETQYEELAARGKTLIERLRSQKATQDLLGQGKATLTRTKAAVTTARHAAADVAASARETLTVGHREAAAVADATKTAAQTAAEAGTEATKEAAEATVAKARKKVARTRAAAKGAAASARKTAAAAVEAVESGAEKVGDLGAEKAVD